MASIRKSYWAKDYGHMSFIEYWGYDIQAAIYQKLVEMAVKKQLPFFIAVASKEPVTDIEIIGFPQKELDAVLTTVEKNVQRIKDLKSGKIEPDRCGSCDYCKLTKVLTKPVHSSQLILNF